MTRHSTLSRLYPWYKSGLVWSTLSILQYPISHKISEGYPGISRMSSYPGISQYKSGFGRVSLFQMFKLNVSSSSLSVFTFSSLMFPSGTLVHLNSGMISRYSSYTWIHIWIHRSWNVTYEFMIMKSYMNSWYEFRYEFMIMKNIVNSYVRIHMYEFTSEFMLVNSWSWNHIWIHMYEFMCEFSAMNNIVKSWLNFWKWIHIWNHGWIH